MSSRRIPTEDREPDPARSYERAKPEKEAGMGRLDTVNATPTNRPGQAKETVRKVHAPPKTTRTKSTTNVRRST